jgi:hypothetical protein
MILAFQHRRRCQRVLGEFGPRSLGISVPERKRNSIRFHPSMAESPDTHVVQTTVGTNGATLTAKVLALGRQRVVKELTFSR